MLRVEVKVRVRIRACLGFEFAVFRRTNGERGGDL